MDTVRFASLVCGCTTLIACPASSRQFLLTCADNFCFGPVAASAIMNIQRQVNWLLIARQDVSMLVCEVLLCEVLHEKVPGTQPKSHPPIAREPGAEW